MAIFVIGDTHLSMGSDKPMDVFEGWTDYTARLESKWNELVSDDDVVVLPGDISWAMTLDEATADFSFLHNSLKGKKIVLKGNHDYWWTTVSKIETFLADNRLTTISILHNNSIYLKDAGIAIAGTRGWQLDSEDADSIKVYRREVGRLRLSLMSAKKHEPDEIIVFLHYPPIHSNYSQDEMIDLMVEYGVKRCYYAHIHGKNINYAVNGVRHGIAFKLVSADYLRFVPYYIDA